MNCYRCRRPAAEGQVFCDACGARLIPDRAMLDAAAAGDRNAAADLYELAYDGVYYTVHAMVRDEDSVLDLVQDSFLKAFANLDRLQDPAKFRPWVKTIARNMAIDELRSKKPLLFSQMLSEDGDAALDFEDDRPEHLPEQVVDQQETARLVREILDALPEDQRLVIALFYYEQLSVRQIAQKLNLNENTVKSRLSLGRKKIESRVRALERQGTRLYSLSPLAFFLALLRQQSQTLPEIPAEVLRESILHKCVRTTVRSAGTRTASTAGRSAGTRVASTTARSAAVSSVGRSAGAKVATAAGRSIAAKIVAAVTAVAIVGGGGAVAAHEIQKHRIEESTVAATEIILPADASAEAGAESARNEAALVGVWDSGDGATLWIQSADSQQLVFSLYVPGRGSINNAVALHNDGESVFRYEDPFHAGHFATGSLTTELDGSPVLGLGDNNLELGRSDFRFPARSAQPDYETQYAPVLEAYREHERSGGGLVNWYGDEEGYVHVGLSGVEHFGYMLWDLDDNGIPELVLGAFYTQEDYDNNSWLDPQGYSANLILDLYSLQDGSPVYLTNSGDRYRYSFTDDGQIHFEGSGGAAYSYFYLYRVDGAALVFVDGAYIAGGEDQCYHIKDRQGRESSDDEWISYEQFQQWMDSQMGYSEEHLAIIQPLLKSVIPAQPVQAEPAQADWELSPAYADIVQMYANLQVLPRRQMESWDYATPPLWSMIERRYSVYYDDTPFEPYYALYDLDGNGTPELFIGLKQQDGSVALAEVYSSNGSRAFRIAVAGFRRNLIGGGKLLLEGGEFFPAGEILRLDGNGYTPVQLLNYGTGCEDPNVYLFDDSRKPDYYFDANLGANSEHRPYSQLENGLMDGMRPAEELLSFLPIAPDASLASGSVPAERSEYTGMLASYEWLNTAEIGPGTGNGLDEDVVRIASYINDNGSHGIWYAYFDGDCDGTEELYVGYPFGQNEHAIACYHIDNGVLRIVSPARFTGYELELNRAPWRAIGGFSAPTMNDD